LAHDLSRGFKMKSNRGFLISIAYSAILTATFLFMPLYVNALSSKDKYLIAENCYRKLKQDSSKQTFRDQWMICIGKYQDVFRSNPNDPWAAAGLYMSGVLYHELFSISGISSDQREAADTFQRIIKRYPSSKYKQKAVGQLEKITSGGKNEASSKNLTHQTSKNLFLDHKDFQQSDPLPDIAAGPEAAITIPGDKTPVATKKSMKRETQKGLPSDPKEPSGSLSDSVLNSEREDNQKKIGAASKNINFVTGLRYWSNPNYTRIVIDADGDTSFKEHLLKPDPELKTPRRLYVDLTGSRLGKDMEKIIPINDDLLKDARAGQFTPETVRVVVDIKTFSKYKIFPLKNPFRIVIDVWGTSTSDAPSSLAAVVNTIPKPEDEKIGPGTLARQLALGVSRIVIDPGHGGKDYGAPGYIKGVHEKEVVLQIAKRLGKMIQNELGCEVFFTRSDDRYLTLEERTAIANTKDADLFISLHTNAHTNNQAYGIETYFLNLATDDEAIRVAARENATSRKNISDLQTILTDLMQNTKINESARLASFVQGSLYDNLNKNYDQIKNKGVKQAPFYVLLGAQMPAILVEVGFISNSRECKRLLTSEYQDHICRGVLNGIRSYIKDTNPTAILTSAP
jgi:N-acetylmuramoyl-L-alanine amidase